MNKKIFKFLFVFLTLSLSENFLNASNWDIYSLDKTPFLGSIVFPKTIKNIPAISLYRRGVKIKTENEDSNKKIRFTISEDKSCRRFYLLITESVMPYIDDNTIKYLKIKPNQDYKFYELTVFTNQELSINPLSKQQEVKETYSWSIIKRPVNADRRIQDDTLIMIFNPNYVESLEQSNSLELPRIIIKKNILDLAGSEKKLQTEINELQLSSILDLDCFHISPASEIKKTDSNKKLIVAMANPD